MFNGPFFDKIYAIFMVSLMGIAVGLIGLLAFFLVDTAVLDESTELTTVVAKQVIAAHSSLEMQGYLLRNRQHEDSFHLQFRVNGEEVSPSVDKEFFEVVKVGDKVKVSFKTKRISGGATITRIELIDR